LSFG
jgi:hypothetical protein